MIMCNNKDVSEMSEEELEEKILELQKILNGESEKRIEDTPFEVSMNIKKINSEGEVVKEHEMSV